MSCDKMPIPSKFPDSYFLAPNPKPDHRKKFLENGGPHALGNDWVEFTASPYAARENRTRVLIDLKDISSVDEDCELKVRNGSEWLTIRLKNGISYIVKATYDEMVNLLAKRDKTSKEDEIDGEDTRDEDAGFH